MKNASGEVRIGTAGWSIPARHAHAITGQGTHLERYSRTLNCGEMNSSFYRSHRESTWLKWGNSVPPGFRFSVKAPKAITHDAKLFCSEEQLSAFLMEARILGEKLGPILFQLPPKLEFEESRVSGFLAMLRQLHAREVVFEPRHHSWFTEEVSQILREFDVARAAADPAIVPEASQAGGSEKLIYYRLHGSPRRYYSAYEDDFLEALAVNICTQARQSEVWCLFDNTASGAALADALKLKRFLDNDFTKKDRL